jgi:hypothetical protein
MLQPFAQELIAMRSKNADLLKQAQTATANLAAEQQAHTAITTATNGDLESTKAQLTETVQLYAKASTELERYKTANQATEALRAAASAAAEKAEALLREQTEMLAAEKAAGAEQEDVLKEEAAQKVQEAQEEAAQRLQEVTNAAKSKQEALGAEIVRKDKEVLLSGVPECMFHPVQVWDCCAASVHRHIAGGDYPCSGAGVEVANCAPCCYYPQCWRCEWYMIACRPRSRRKTPAEVSVSDGVPSPGRVQAACWRLKVETLQATLPGAVRGALDRHMATLIDHVLSSMGSSLDEVHGACPSTVIDTTPTPLANTQRLHCHEVSPSAMITTSKHDHETSQDAPVEPVLGHSDTGGLCESPLDGFGAVKGIQEALTQSVSLRRGSALAGSPMATGGKADKALPLMPERDRGEGSASAAECCRGGKRIRQTIQEPVQDDKGNAQDQGPAVEQEKLGKDFENMNDTGNVVIADKGSQPVRKRASVAVAEVLAADGMEVKVQVGEVVMLRSEDVMESGQGDQHELGAGGVSPPTGCMHDSDLGATLAPGSGGVTGLARKLRLLRGQGVNS